MSNMSFSWVSNSKPIGNKWIDPYLLYQVKNLVFGGMIFESPITTIVSSSFNLRKIYINRQIKNVVVDLTRTEIPIQRPNLKSITNEL